MWVCSYKTATFGELALNAGGGYELVDINSRRPPPRSSHAATPRSTRRHAPGRPTPRRPAPHASPTRAPPPRSSRPAPLRPPPTSAPRLADQRPAAALQPRHAPQPPYAHFRFLTFFTDPSPSARADYADLGSARAAIAPTPIHLIARQPGDVRGTVTRRFCASAASQVTKNVGGWSA